MFHSHFCGVLGEKLGMNNPGGKAGGGGEAGGYSRAKD